MANYTITWSCGHTTDKQLYGKETERTRYREWARTSGQCEACRKADRLAATEAVEAEHDLPALTGSDKQVAWGRTIRAEKITEMCGRFETIRATVPGDKVEQFDAQAAAVMQGLYGKIAAGWWIDNREVAGKLLSQTIYKESRA